MNRECNILHLAGKFQGLYWIQIFGLQFYEVSNNNGKAEYKRWKSKQGREGLKEEFKEIIRVTVLFLGQQDTVRVRSDD